MGDVTFRPSSGYPGCMDELLPLTSARLGRQHRPVRGRPLATHNQAHFQHLGHLPLTALPYQELITLIRQNSASQKTATWQVLEE